MSTNRFLAPLVLTLAIGLAAVPGLALGWDYSWDDPVLYDYSFGYDDYMYDDYYYSPNQYQNQYVYPVRGLAISGESAYNPASNGASAYQAYQPTYYQQSQYLPVRGTQTGQSQYSNYGYGGQQGYQAYGFSNGTPTGDTIPYVNEPLCNYPGYGRYSCLYHPGQPVYDYWTGTWY